MSQNEIKVGMGEGVVTSAPHIISSTGIGSCVVVTLYDLRRRIGGLAHVMFPDSTDINGRRPPYHCADTAIAALLRRLQSNGAMQENIVAKMIGGARMFDGGNGSSPGIGKQNINSVRQILIREKLSLAGEDTGGGYGRSVEFNLDSGKVIVRTVGREDREL